VREPLHRRDLLVVERNADFAYSVWDYTPTERREDQGQGDPEPNTMALRIVKEHVLKARGEDGTGEDRITAKEVWEQLLGEISGQGRQAPSSKTVKRWLDRWITNGVLVEGKKVKVAGVKAPVQTYTLPTTSSRALPAVECLLSIVPSKPLQEQEITMDTPQSPEYDVHRSEVGQPVPENDGHQPDSEKDVHRFSSVVPSDLEERRTTDSPTRTTRAHAREAEPLEVTADLGGLPVLLN
jgi:hypothetical protein